MKRISILVVVTLLVVGSMFAEQATLIDFSQLSADISIPTDNPPKDADGNDVLNENKATLVTLDNEASGNFTSRKKVTMQTSLSIENWGVVLTSSARNVETKHLSFTKTAESKSNAFNADGADGDPIKVMGVRVHFPLEAFNVSADVKPPFPIPAFDGNQVGDDGTLSPSEEFTGMDWSRFEGSKPDDSADPKTNQIAFGIVKNVGTIKSIAVQVYGLNFPHALYVLLVDDKGVETPYFMGYLRFEGWGELRWDNPAYVQEVRNRELRIEPIYPDSTPYVKFAGFRIQRQASSKGGDFVTYFKDVQIIYDKAVLESDRDINDEATWEIVKTRDTEQSKTDLQNLGQIHLQRKLDLDRQATESFIKQ